MHVLFFLQPKEDDQKNELWADWDEEVEDESRMPQQPLYSVKDLIKQELVTYLALKRERRDVNPLIWWAERKNELPYLYRAAMKKLSPPGMYLLLQLLLISIFSLILNDFLKVIFNFRFFSIFFRK